MKISQGKGLNNRRVMMVHMNREEAMLTVQSLVTQILANNGNVGRFEKYTDENIDFSIAVLSEKKA